MGPVYLIGNGKIAAAIQNGNMIQVFGPPYSSPSIFEILFKTPDLTIGNPSHTPQAPVWKSTLFQNQKEIGWFEDFVHAKEQVVVRHIETIEPITLELKSAGNKDALLEYALVTELENGVSILYKTNRGNAVYNDYPLPFPQFFTVQIRNATCKKSGAFGWEIGVCGEADLYIIGGPSYPECDLATQRLQGRTYEELKEETLESWRAQLKKIHVMDSIPQEFPFYERLKQAIEDTALNLLTQQSTEGGVLAGYLFHLAYIRDQFGMFRGFLRLGLYDSARAMLSYYGRVFLQSGKVLNAQGMGVEGLFHFAENDAVEITGYLLFQFFEYARVTHDEELLKTHHALLEWLYLQQAEQLVDGTLPFNGDETYIAGGLLPRDVICDGSAEATMLFLLTGKKLLAFEEQYGFVAQEQLIQMEKQLSFVESSYLNHFLKNGRYVLNDPARYEKSILPEYRYGVCMNLGTGDCQFFGWTKRCEGDVYLCPVCQKNKRIPKRKIAVYDIPSALLLPAYLDSHLLPVELLQDYAKELVSKVQKEGHFYSEEEQKKNVGYDYGLLLYNLVYFDLDGKELICEKLLGLLDECGAWSEYYIEGKPFGCRYRPWDSAINLDALLYYAQHYTSPKEKHI